jgi:hypothetical protein
MKTGWFDQNSYQKYVARRPFTLAKEAALRACRFPQFDLRSHK